MTASTTDRRRAAGQEGFTLIELLVVILIIGILAAMALPAFLGQKSKAQDTQAKAQVRTAALTIESYFINQQTYAPATPAALMAIEPALADGVGNTLAVTSSSATDYTIAVTSLTGTTFSIVKTLGVVERRCDQPGKGGCLTGGVW